MRLIALNVLGTLAAIWVLDEDPGRDVAVGSYTWLSNPMQQRAAAQVAEAPWRARPSGAGD